MTTLSVCRSHPEDMENNAEVAQPGRALDSLLHAIEGEAEDRVVAGSNPALGTTPSFLPEEQCTIWSCLRYFGSFKVSAEEAKVYIELEGKKRGLREARP